MSDQNWAQLSNELLIVALVVYANALLLTAAASFLRIEDEERRTVIGTVGYRVTILGVVVHFGADLSRGFAAHRVPWGNMYEFTMTGSLIVAAAYVILRPRLKLAWMGPFVSLFVLAALIVAKVVLYTPVLTVSDSLHSYWLVVHVVSLALATGAFTLGGIASVMYLLKNRNPDATGWLSRIPTLPTLDRTAYRIQAFGFVLWTFGALIAGPIWAHEAWGSYWNWDPKEVWAFITWVVYACYLHARATAGWRGRNAAILAIVGLATLWFNFVGINYFFGGASQHSYATPNALEVHPL